MVIQLSCIFASFYVYYATGLMVGTLLIIGGVAITQSVSWAIVRCADHYEAYQFEDIAMKSYGKKLATFISYIMLATQIGMLVTNVVLLKTLIPHMIQQLMGRNLPQIISTTQTGQMVWAVIFCFAIQLPLSLPRELTATRYANTICLFLAIYFSLSIPFICLFNR